MSLIQQFKNARAVNASPLRCVGARESSLAETLISLVRRTARHPLTEGTMLLAGSQYIAAAIGLVTSVASARLLGPKDFGLVAVVTSYPMLLGSLVAVKSGLVTTRYIARFRAERQVELLGAICKLGYALDFLVSLVAALLIAATSDWVAAKFFHNPDIAWMMIGFAASLPVWSLSGTSQAILSSFERFSWVALLQVLDQVIGSCLVIGLLLGGFGVAGAVLGAALGNVIIAFIATALAHVALRREGQPAWWRSEIAHVRPLRREINGLFGWNYLVVTGTGLMGQLPVMLLAHFSGPEAAGFYRLAVSIVTVGSYFETSMGKVVYPTLSASWSAQSRARMRAGLKRWTTHAGLPVCALVLLSLPFFPILIPVIFGAPFKPVVRGAQIMMAGAALSALFFWLNSAYYASANLNIWTLGYAVQTVVVLGLAWFVAGYWGFTGMALLTAVGKAGFTLAMLLVFNRVVAVQKEGIS